MKNRYKKKAYYFDEDVLLCGYKDKRGFHPEYGLPCGFGLQIIRKRDIGKKLFYSLEQAVDKLKEVELAGDKFIFAIDDGMAETKISFSQDKSQEPRFYKSKEVFKENEITVWVKKCLKEIGLKEVHHTTVEYKILSNADIIHKTVII